MVRDNLELMSVESLRDLASREGIDVPDTVEKVLLIDLILEELADEDFGSGIPGNLQVQAEVKKFDAGAVLTAESARNDPVTEQYVENRVVLLLKDPWWAFAYWDLKPVEHGEKRDAENESLILRVHMLTAEGFETEETFDILVKGRDRQWYIQIPEAGRRYVVEVIQNSRGGVSQVLCRSNELQVPRGMELEGAVDVQVVQGIVYELSGWRRLDITTSSTALLTRAGGRQ